ncbi:putative porin [Tepidimonas ignava]|uniref:Outer membrane porin protein 32 n=1 Tax=Tepidimonas ignava TaxID=114249 RepID=A0A4R3LDW9_9BURK|nr:porin [Tepidimonas ignava]TCS98361.1 putative porin [Tepidimonas ignava]TSE19523.1 Outer membrane porin protein 32 [Tepidimonas ignava]
MKKTLIALAAVAATGAAFAQSSVTLSGVIDAGFEKRFSGDPFKMTPNRNGTSNWTLSGTEDLGGGLKANFSISTSFNSDDGTTAGNVLGNNGMFVGLTGGFGTVRMGRPVNTLYGNALLANGTKGVSFYDANAVLGGNATASAKVGGASSSVFVSNAIQYHSPRFGGVQVQVEYAPREVKGSGTADGFGLAVRYDEGPLALSFVNYKGADSNADGVKQKAVNQLAAAYDFGVARVLFTWRDQGGLPSNRDNSYALGVTAPVGPGSLYASYNVNEQPGTDGRTLIAGYKYNLSKRTQMYVNVANRNKAWLGGVPLPASNPGTMPNKSTTGFGFGLQHSF